MNFFFSPLEQFEILPIYTIFFVIITNQVVILALTLFFLITLFFSLVANDFEQAAFAFVIPRRIQVIIEIIYSMLLGMTLDNINGKHNAAFFPLIFSIFFFISFMNLIGLVPYSFTVTSHFIVTLTLSISIFIGINIISIRIHGLEFFSLFLPSGTSTALAFLLVPVELISFIFKPLSLAIRLFCNMMAGHTLLKVFVGFAWTLINFSGLAFLLHIVPLLILFPLFGLELGVALIQSYVFSLLTCIYLNDAINLH
jgi:F-type H+-transporting ATPase subunit a